MTGVMSICGLNLQGADHPVVQKAVQECLEVSDNLQRLVGEGKENETRALDLVQTQDRGFALNALPETYKRLVKQKEKAIEAARLWDEVAATSQRCLDPTDGLLKTLSEAAEVISPSEIEHDDRDMLEFSDVNRDLDDVQECTRELARSSFGRPNEGVVSRGPVMNSIRRQQEKVSEFFTKIGEIASALATWARDMLSGGCCTQLLALGQALAECIRHANLLQTLARGLRKLVQGVQSFMQQSCKTFSSLITEFPAAKKIGKFVKKEVGKRIGKLIGKFT